jgi:hypothetical protein
MTFKDNWIRLMKAESTATSLTKKEILLSFMFRGYVLTHFQDRMVLIISRLCFT